MTLDSLLAQIRANPHDDQRRAVYADALLAGGDERGEYMHLELQGGYSERLTELRQREKAWSKELGLGDISVVWARGLPDCVIATPHDIVAHANALAQLPVVRISIPYGARELERLVALPAFARIEELSLGNLDKPIAEADFVTLAAANLCSLRRISFDKAVVDMRGAALIGRAPWFTQLTRLDVASLDGPRIEALFSHPMPNLRELHVWSASLGAPGAQALANATLPSLQYLRLDNARLHSGAPYLFAAPLLRSLRRLAIADDWLREEVVALAASPHVRSLRELELQRDMIDDAGAAALACSPHLVQLQVLDLESNTLEREGALALAHGLPALTRLVLRGNPMPSGETYYEESYDQGFLVGGGDVSIEMPRDALHALFADRPSLEVVY